ncbi:MAG TPA: NADP-dependent oxidoreductase [Steroidobacteraceae bacterium]
MEELLVTNNPAKIRKMRIHQFGDKETLRLDNVEFSLPDAAQVLVSVRAASVNPVDFKIRNGKYPAVKEDRLPYTLGRDVSGVVEQRGAQAESFAIGDEVFGMVGIGGGGYADKVVLDLKAIARKPPGLDHSQAAALVLAGQTAWQGLFRHGGLKEGQSVLIHGGSGGVGHLAVQFAKAKGARVFTTVSTENVAFARSLGADVVIDYKTQRFEEHTGKLDLVFDLIDGETRERSWQLLKRGATLVSTLTAPSQDTARELGVRALRYTVEADGNELAQIADLVVAGKVRSHVSKTYPLEQAARALSTLEQGHAVGKIVLLPT